MKWIKYIWILIIIYLVCSARTCNESEETTEMQKEQYTVTLMRSVKHVFTSDSLSDPLLRAYEITAMGKLTDFTDYMKIISDTTLDLKFRQHAADLVKGLFVTNEIELYNCSGIYPGSGLNTLELLLAHSLSEGIPCRIDPFRITVRNPFVSKNDSTFIGNLSFINKCGPISRKNTSEIVSVKLVFDIYLVKKLKSFGKDRIGVWEVYLGDMNEESGDEH
jgi:hypothetical protein